jgi:alanyl-tRNA synthetase
LGEKICYVELAPSQGRLPTVEQLAEAEKTINSLIASGSPVITHVECNAADDNRPDSLPSDYRGGVIRTIEIPGIDKNPCCGTHASNLSQLQSIKFLHTEKIRGNNMRLFFVVGRRVLELLDSTYTTCKTLTGMLSCGAEMFVPQITRLQTQQRAQAKAIKRLMAELAGHAVNDLADQVKQKGYAMVHREDADMEYLVLLGNGAKEQKLLEESAVIVLAGGEQAAGGPIIVLGGNDESVKKVAQALTQHLDGLKGGGKGRWQGKCKTWKGWETAKAAVDAMYSS